MQDGDEKETGWVFEPGDSSPPETDKPRDETASGLPQGDYPRVEWTASEYIAHQKTGGWYVLLALGSAGVAAVVYFVTDGDLISTSVILILGLSLGVFAARQPRELTYVIDHTGLYIGEKFYPYQSFKTFSVVRDQGLGYISLAPLRRFMPPLTVHYDPEDEDKIAETLSQYLPYDDHKPDITDIIARKIRF